MFGCYSTGLHNPVSQLSLLCAEFTRSTFVDPQLNQLIIRVHANQLSDQQKNKRAKNGHLARAARGVHHFEKLCRTLQLSHLVIQRIEYDHKHMGLQELAMQALLKWQQEREVTTVGNVVSVLSLAGEVDAIENLVDYCNSE